MNARSRFLHGFLLGSLAVPLLVSASGCGQRSAVASPGESVPEPRAVTIGRPQRELIRRTIQQPGQIDGFETTPLFGKVAGYVKKLHVDIGDAVKADQVLADLWVPELVEELRQKDASVTLAKAEVDMSEHAVKAAEAALARSEASVRFAEAGLVRANADVARWQSEYTRVRKLLPSRATDEQTRDTVVDQLHTAEAARTENEASIELAKASREQSRAMRDQAGSNLAVSRAKLTVAAADRDRTAAMLLYTKITAPFDGVITRRPVDTGHFVQPSVSGTPGAVPLFIVVRTDPVRVYVDVPESDAAQIANGMAVSVRVPALQEQEFQGTVTRTSWTLDSMNRTMRTRIDLPNRDGRLRPGMFVSAKITVERPNVLTVPAESVLTSDEQSSLVRYDAGKAVRMPVKLGVRQGPRVEVLKKQTGAPARGEPISWENLTGQEDIVLNPTGLSDGQAVQPAPTSADRTGRQLAQNQ